MQTILLFYFSYFQHFFSFFHIHPSISQKSSSSTAMRLSFVRMYVCCSAVRCVDAVRLNSILDSRYSTMLYTSVCVCCMMICCCRCFWLRCSTIICFGPNWRINICFCLPLHAHIFDHLFDPIHLSCEAASAYKHKIMYVFEVCIWYAISFIHAAKMMQLVVVLFSFSFRFVVLF